MTCHPADGCGTRCRRCHRSWCREQQISPGEAVNICRSCWDTEADHEGDE